MPRPEDPGGGEIPSMIGNSSNARCVPRRYWLNTMMRAMVRPPIPQCVPATGAPNLKSARPISAMVGAMVSGPTKRSSRPTRPLYPTAISKSDPAITAPCTCRILTSQPASASAAIPQIANAGVRKENVPPCTSGSRLPQVVWSSVVIPLTKNIVPISRPTATGSPAMPSGSASSSGMATVEPNIVR
jgi:hypothetical protein